MSRGPNKKAPTVAEYQRIEIDLRRQIGSGRWASGVMLPSRRDLARQYSVSLLTMSRAIEPLLSDGTLRADNRRGTFVGSPIATGLSVDDPAFASPFRAWESDALRLDGSGPGLPVRKSIAVVTFFPNPHRQEYIILHTLEQIFASTDSVVCVVNRARTDGPPTLSLPEAIEAALADQPDGLIITALEQDIRLVEADLENASLRDIPTVCILPGEISLLLPHVFYDNRSGGYQAMQHLIARGLAEFTIVAPFTASWVTERIIGMQAAVSHSRLTPNPARIIKGKGHPWTDWEDPRPVAYHAVKAEMEAGWQLSGGILCVSDGVAFGVLDAAAERGLRPGKDFAILGFDDDYEARASGLTSVRPPIAAMAREAARLLHDQWQGADTSLRVRLRAHVIPRMSSEIEIPAPPALP